MSPIPIPKVTLRDRLSEYPCLLKAGKYLGPFLALVIVLSIFQRICYWDKAEVELKKHPNTFGLMLHSSSTYRSNEPTSRAQTFLMVPGYFRLPYTVSIESHRDEVTVEVDDYGLLKILLLLFVVLPLLSRLARRLGFNDVKVEV